MQCVTVLSAIFLTATLSGADDVPGDGVRSPAVSATNHSGRRSRRSRPGRRQDDASPGGRPPLATEPFDSHLRPPSHAAERRTNGVVRRSSAWRHRTRLRLRDAERRRGSLARRQPRLVALVRPPSADSTVPCFPRYPRRTPASNLAAQKAEARDAVRASLQKGIPALAWQAMSPEQKASGIGAGNWGMLAGYDDTGRTYTVRHNGEPGKGRISPCATMPSATPTRSSCST